MSPTTASEISTLFTTNGQVDMTTVRPLGQNGTNSTIPYNKPSSVILMLSFWLIFFLIALVGNGMVCAVVLRVEKMRTATNYLLVNLAIADLLTALCTPLTVLDFAKSDNSFGKIGCKLQIFTLDVFYAASTFTLICVAIERYFAVCRPMRFKQLREHLKLMMCMIWLCACIVYSPMLWACTLRDKEVNGESQLSCDCNSSWPKWWHYTIYAMCIVTFLYILPVFVMFRCYIPVIMRLWKPSNVSSKSSERNDQRKMVVKTLITVMMVFCILWTPYNVLYVLKKFRVDFRSVYGIVWYGAVILAFLSNCVNPIVYTLMNRNFRDSVRQVFRKQRKISRKELLESDEDLSTSQSPRMKTGKKVKNKKRAVGTKERSSTESMTLDSSEDELSKNENETKM